MKAPIPRGTGGRDFFGGVPPNPGEPKEILGTAEYRIARNSLVDLLRGWSSGWQGTESDEGDGAKMEEFDDTQYKWFVSLTDCDKDVLSVLLENKLRMTKGEVIGRMKTTRNLGNKYRHGN